MPALSLSSELAILREEKDAIDEQFLAMRTRARKAESQLERLQKENKALVNQVRSVELHAESLRQSSSVLKGQLLQSQLCHQDAVRELKFEQRNSSKLEKTLQELNGERNDKQGVDTELKRTNDRLLNIIKEKESRLRELMEKIERDRESYQSLQAAIQTQQLLHKETEIKLKREQERNEILQTRIDSRL
ncbi:hypothetical protein DL96DRAFT_1603709 [Flagelloscypha sp. PMI_526]|nr:hypothetical protein DL96DRAFT_1603709 [Flagelloscypha sp. PMI_526]